MTDHSRSPGMNDWRSPPGDGHRDSRRTSGPGQSRADTRAVNQDDCIRAARLCDTDVGMQTEQRTEAMRMRGTPADAPKIVRLFDDVAVRTPDSDYGNYLWLWAEEVTRLLSKIEDGQ